MDIGDGHKTKLTGFEKGWKNNYSSLNLNDLIAELNVVKTKLVIGQSRRCLRLCIGVTTGHCSIRSMA